MRSRTLYAAAVSIALAACTDDDAAGAAADAARPSLRADMGATISGDALIIPGGEADLLPLVDVGPSPDGGAGGGGVSEGGSGGGGASGGSGGHGGGGPGPDPDAAVPRPDAQIGECATLSSRGEAAARPTDIVWFIDASPSMRQEIETVTANLNAFAAGILDAGVDARVVIVGPHQQIYPQRDAQEFFPICVPPPLSGSAGCPDTDGERYRHVRVPLHSREALAVGLDQLGAFRDFLRPGAATHVVVVTDDDERSGARVGAEFDRTFGGLAPGYTFHSVIDLIGYIDGCGLFDDDPCSCGENRGQTYIDLSTATGGVIHSICEPDWAPLFEALQARVIDSAVIPCAYALPPPRNGLEVDPEHVNVDLTAPDGTVTALFNVGDAAGCAGDPQGWYYDDPAAPTQVRLCDGACGAREGEVQITLGCTIRKR
jgi:hypothetical protein